jgi:hypothetical protein
MMVMMLMMMMMMHDDDDDGDGDGRTRGRTGERRNKSERHNPHLLLFRQLPAWHKAKHCLCDLLLAALALPKQVLLDGLRPLRKRTTICVNNVAEIAVGVVQLPDDELEVLIIRIPLLLFVGHWVCCCNTNNRQDFFWGRARGRGGCGGGRSSLIDPGLSGSVLCRTPSLVLNNVACVHASRPTAQVARAVDPLHHWQVRVAVCSKKYDKPKKLKGRKRL